MSIIPLGLGFLAILRDPQRRAWHDRMTGTEVVYESVDRQAPYSSTDPASTRGAPGKLTRALGRRPRIT